ncbi:MAG: hypothetical protein M3Q58_10030 [Bacteroidota bacterium]|nr:hypothetical protein [Bacteroidota bacterium]
MIGEIILFILFIIISIALLVLMVVLMYKAYSVSCNIKGTKGVVSFIGALLLAEIVSKIVHDFLYKNVG